jgi:cysteinyl-tRNA synthetase
MGDALGILQQDPEAYLRGGASGDGMDDAHIDDLIAQRQQAKADKNWGEADRIRDELQAAGIVLEDGPGGTTWRRA